MRRELGILLLALVCSAASLLGGALPLEEGVEAPAFSPFGDVPFLIDLAFPGVGEFAFTVATPVLVGLDKAVPTGPQTPDPVSGEWTNFSLPELQVRLGSSFEVTNATGLHRVSLEEVEYTLADVKVALELVDHLDLGGCLSAPQAVVDVGTVFKSVKCSNTTTTCPNSGEGSAIVPDLRAVEGAISETLRTPAALKVLLRDGREICNATSSTPELRRPSMDLQPGTMRELWNWTDNIQWPEKEQESQNGAIAIFATLIVLLVLGIVAAVTCCGCCMGCCCWRNPQETVTEQQFLDQCHSIVHTPTLPLWVKVAFYLFIAINTAFFLQANLYVGATINLDYTVEGVFVEMPAIYDFSILASTIQMLEAGVYLLGFILMGFSVFWPYIKLIILTVMFSLSTTLVRPARRAAIMDWIDTLGKWSMFDVFALCVCMVIFFVNIVSPETELYPLGWYGFTLSMTPVWGMYANLIAQIISQCLSIFALWAHDRAYKSDWHEFHNGGDAAEFGGWGSAGSKGKVLEGTESDASHSQDIGQSPVSKGEANVSAAPSAGRSPLPPPMPAGAVMTQDLVSSPMPMRFTALAQIAVVAMLVTVIILVITGFFITGFTVEVIGILGLVQEAAIKGSATRYFSPLYVAQQMTTVIPPGNVGILIGTWGLIIMFVVCVSVVPVVQAAVLLCVWVLPVPLPRLKSLLKANQLLASWQFMEVYLIAVIVGCLQIPVVCKLLVGDKCDPIQDELELLKDLGIISHATCFSMLPQMKAGMWCLFCASIILYICSVIVREAGYSIANTYDPFRAAQNRGKTPGQILYYSRRARALNSVGLVRFLDGVKPPSPDSSVPVASAVTI